MRAAVSHYLLATAMGLGAASPVCAEVISLTSPDGRVGVVVSDTAGLRYRVSLDGQPVLVDSRLGLDFAGGVSLGRLAKIAATSRSAESDLLDWFGMFVSAVAPGADRTPRHGAKVALPGRHEIRVPLTFLGAGSWQLRAFADTPESARHPQAIADTTRTISSTDTVELTLAPAGGYAAVLAPKH